MQIMYWNCFPRFSPNQLQKGKAHLEDQIWSPQRHLGLSNKEYYLCVDTCGHHHVTERIPRDREEDSVFCLPDDSRLPADIHITVSWPLRNVADATVNGTNQKPDQLLFPISCMHVFLEMFFFLCVCVFSYCLMWRICYFSLFKMQNLNYNLQVLCTAEFLTQHPMNHPWLSY